MTDECRPIESLRAFERNAKTHPPEQIERLAASISDLGLAGPIIVRDGVIAKGHGTLRAVRAIYDAGGSVHPVPGKAAGAPPFPAGSVPVVDATGWTDEQFRSFVIADNRIAERAGWDETLLSAELADLRVLGVDLAAVGFDASDLARMLGADDEQKAAKPQAPSLADRFLIPPMSVLNAREGWWQERKAAWISIGIKSELGRGGAQSQRKGRKPNAIPGGSPMVSGYSPSGERLVGLRAARKSSSPAGLTVGAIDMDGPPESGTSVFDPVLTELAYRWFCPPGGTILDPFAGGSVRGIVAAKLGRRYLGVELRPEQVAANEQQARDIVGCGELAPTWHCGDSRDIDALCGDALSSDDRADFIFSCPPYADLERYSDDPADLSTMPYVDFLSAYREIVAKSCSLLLPDRFACFVVGEVRDKAGAYRNFVGDTVQAFRDAGLSFYNEAILVTALGSMPIRVGKQFVASRKLGKTHQNVLVFVKGSGSKAACRCGPVEVADIDVEPSTSHPAGAAEAR